MTQPPRDIHDLMTAGQVAPPEKLLGQEDKEALAEAGTTFTVLDVSLGEDAEYGPFWQVRAELDGKPVQFRLSQHDRRDPFMQSIAGIITSGPITGLRLKAYAGRGGNAFVQMEPA